MLVLLAQLVMGLLSIFASAQHMDGSVMVLLANWAQSVVTFQPIEAAEAMASVGLLFKLHIVLGLTLFVLFPFTRLVHIISAPVWYLGRRYQIVRQKGTRPVVGRAPLPPVAASVRKAPTPVPVPVPAPAYAFNAAKVKDGVN